MQEKSAKGIRRSEEQWTEILRRFDSSGLSSRQFCERDRIPLSSLQRWQRRLRSVAPAKFVEIVPRVVPSAIATSWSVEVSLPNGTTLRFQA